MPDRPDLLTPSVSTSGFWMDSDPFLPWTTRANAGQYKPLVRRTGQLWPEHTQYLRRIEATNLTANSLSPSRLPDGMSADLHVQPRFQQPRRVTQLHGLVSQTEIFSARFQGLAPMGHGNQIFRSSVCGFPPSRCRPQHPPIVQGARQRPSTHRAVLQIAGSRQFQRGSPILRPSKTPTKSR